MNTAQNNDYTIRKLGKNSLIYARNSFHGHTASKHFELNLERQMRGVLCTKCNTGLHYLENLAWFEPASAYLALWKEKQKEREKLGTILLSD